MKSKKAEIDHIKAMVRVAEADGETSSETELIMAVTKRYGLSKSDIDKVRKKPQSVKESLPDSMIDRTQQLYDLAMMVLCDGKVSPEELNIARARTQLLGFEMKEFDKILRSFGICHEQGESVSVEN